MTKTDDDAKRLIGELAALYGCAIVGNEESGRDVLVTHGRPPYQVGGTKSLKDKYGEGKTRTIINRAIRAEITGGGSVLDARTLLHQHKEFGDVVAELEKALFAMENEIRIRYGMKILT